MTAPKSATEHYFSTLYACMAGGMNLMQARAEAKCAARTYHSDMDEIAKTIKDIMDNGGQP